MDIRSLLAAALRLLLTLAGGVGSRTPPPPDRTERAEDPAVPGALVPAAAARAPSLVRSGPARALPAPPAGAAHALRLDAASVLVISEPPADRTGTEARAAPPQPNPVTVVVLPAPAGTARPRAPGNSGRGRTATAPCDADRPGNGQAAAGGPRPWWRPAGLPGAPSDGLRGSWDGGREPWFTGRWAR